MTGLVHSALASPTVQRAVACRHWRETYTATTRPDGTVVEGYVDMLRAATGVADIRPVLLFLHPESGAVTVPLSATRVPPLDR